MRKIKRFNLNQSRYLSADEMAKLNGGEHLHEKCNDSNIGESCLAIVDGEFFSGECCLESSYSTDGSTTNSSQSYYCKPIF